MNLKSLFKRRYPYAPIAILGRKNVEKIMGAKIIKYKKVCEQSQQEQSARD